MLGYCGCTLMECSECKLFPLCGRIAYIEFKTEADAEKTFEEKQGTEIDGRSVSLCYTGEKGQNQDHRGGKNSTWSGKGVWAG